MAPKQWSFIRNPNPGKISLAPGTDLSNYNEYIVVKPLPNVEQAIAAPWFDLPGGGTQLILLISIKELIKDGYIILK